MKFRISIECDTDGDALLPLTVEDIAMMSAGFARKFVRAGVVENPPRRS